MSENLKGTDSLRILLRQQKTGLYLQASGEWGGSRDSAKGFEDSVIAYAWAKEQKLIGANVLMALAEEHYDVVLARV